MKRNIKIKVAALLLLFTLLFTSCDFLNKTPKETGEATKATEEGDSGANAEGIDLSLYAIVTAAVPGKSVTSAYRALQNAAKESLNLDLAQKKDTEAEEGKFEILIGATNRAVSARVEAELAEKQYAIVFEEDRIILIGKTEALTAKAVDVFCNLYLGTGKTTLSLSESEKKQIFTEETVPIIENAKTSYIIVFPDGDYNLEKIAGDLKSSINLYTGINVTVLSDSAAKNSKLNKGYEIMVGCCDRDEVRHLKENVAYNQYGVFLVKNAICLFGWNLTSTNSAVSVFGTELKKGYSSTAKSYLMDKNTAIKKTYLGWNVSFPEFPADAAGVSDTGEDQLELYYTGTSLTDYSMYLSALSAAGYSKDYENTWNQNKFACYTNTQKNNTLYVTYTPCDGVTRLVSANANAVKTLDAAKQTGYTKIADTQLTQVPVLNDGTTGGMCYIVTLEDGSFIVYDGGMNQATNSNSDKIYNALKALNKRTDNKIVIAAWVLTHEHYDHYHAFAEFAIKYKNEIVIEAMISQRVSTLINTESDSGNDFYGSLLNKMQSAVGNFPVIRVHTGQLLKIRNVEMEILYTPEDLYPIATEKFNNTSLITRLNLNGTKALIIADVQEEGGRILLNRFGTTLKSDYATMVHHGYWGAELNVYSEGIRPSVLLWPESKSLADALTSNSSSAEAYKKRNYAVRNSTYVKEIYFAEGNPKTFTFSK